MGRERERERGEGEGGERDHLSFLGSVKFFARDEKVGQSAETKGIHVHDIPLEFLGRDLRDIKLFRRKVMKLEVSARRINYNLHCGRSNDN